MRYLWIPAAVIGATLTVYGCKDRKNEPVPGPQSTTSAPAPDGPGPRNGAAVPRRPEGASGIAWFQGAIDEAFSMTCGRGSTLLRY